MYSVHEASRSDIAPGTQGPILAFWITILGILAPQLGLAEDLVVVTRLQPPGESRRRGTIADFTGTALTLQLPTGREESIPSSRVVRFETEQVPDQTKGDQQFAEDQFAEAVVSYRRAIERERRPWMRRILLAQMTRCYTNMDQFDRAGETFRVIARSDSTTQLLDAIPLAWVSSQPSADLLDVATHWLETKDAPMVQLMGASWLLPTPSRQRALEVLTNLTDTSDRRIGILADAQLWRNKLVTASLQDVEQWAKQLAALDESLRAGPYFLIGQAWARHGRHKSAALAFLRVSILYPQQQNLAAEALLAAGQQLEEMGDAAGARIVYTELVRTCKSHRLAPVAQQRLERGNVE